MTVARPCLVLLALCLALPARAQRPEATENVTVTGEKAPPEKLLHDFVTSYTAPSPASGKVARWREGVCPIATGLPVNWSKAIVARVLAVAKETGAPVGADGCRPNIDIVFTKNPQMLLDGIRAKKSFLLGYHDLVNEKKLATVNHPVQAWYMTRTVDAKGDVSNDDKLHSQGVTFTGGLGNSFDFPSAHVEQYYGSHLADGRRSELGHAVIVADLDRIDGVNLTAMADYIAMLALAQTASFEVCQPVPSVTNLLSPGCNLKTVKASDSDMAYLHALYTTDPRASLIEQRGDIAFAMKKALIKDGP
jgi:hypothetical protein